MGGTRKALRPFSYANARGAEPCACKHNQETTVASVNKVILIGNLGSDPDMRQASTGTAIANLSIATTRRYRNAEGQPVSETEWHRVVLFGRTAEIARDYLHKGSPAYIEGRLRTRKWTDQQGQDRYTTEIFGDVLQLIGGRDDQQGAAPAGGNSEGEPF